jgi:hypothetical protein
MGTVVNGNNLMTVDESTNAQVPVMEAYEVDIPGKEVRGNRLYVHDPKTNALVPVVHITGFVVKKTEINALFVEKIGLNDLIYPKYFRYDKDLTVKSVVVSANAVGATFSMAGEDYDHDSLAGVSIPAGTDLVIEDIDIAAGQDVGSITITFL